MLVIEQRRPEQVEVSALLVALEPASDAVKDPVPVGVADPSLAEVTVGRIPQRRPVHVVLSDPERVKLETDVSDGTEPLLPVSVLSDVGEVLSSELVGDGRIPHNNPVHVVEASEGEELESTDEADPELGAELTSEGIVVRVGLLGATEKSEVVDGLQTVSPNKLTDRTPSHCWLVLPTLVGAESVLEDVAGLDPGDVVDASELVPPISLDTTLDPDGEITGALDSEGTLVVVAVADDELPLDSEVVTGPQRALTLRPNNCNPAAQEVVGAASDEDRVVPSDEGGTELVEGDVDFDVAVLADVVKSADDAEPEVGDKAVDEVTSVADDESITEALESVADDVGSEDDDEALDDDVGSEDGDEAIADDVGSENGDEAVDDDVGSEDGDEAVDDDVFNVDDESVAEGCELELFGAKVIPRI
ncbi:hypothetical protein ACEPAG_1643 [Sanghuangporus baumii]